MFMLSWIKVKVLMKLCWRNIQTLYSASYTLIFVLDSTAYVIQLGTLYYFHIEEKLATLLYCLFSMYKPIKLEKEKKKHMYKQVKTLCLLYGALLCTSIFSEFWLDQLKINGDETFYSNLVTFWRYAHQSLSNVLFHLVSTFSGGWILSL